MRMLRLDSHADRNAWAGPGLALLAAALILYTSFSAGGFFAGTPAVAAALLAVGLVLRITLAEHPFAGVGARLLIPAGALALYAVWVFVSAAWSHAPGRATIEFDRALLYLLALVLFGSWPRTRERSRWLVRGVAAAFVVVCTVALVSRLLPDVLHTAPNLHNERLSYPLTYWNALGVMAAFGTVLCLHLSASIDEPPAVRVAAAGALPVLCTVLYFTFSRGGIAAAVVGVLVFAVFGRSRSLPLAVLAGAPAAAIAVVVAYKADLLARPDVTTAAATAQGHHVALVTLACVAGALVIRAALCTFERRLAAAAPPVRLGRAGRLVALGAAIVVLVIAAVALRVPTRIDHAFGQFTHESRATSGERDLRQRLTDASNNGRLDLWRVSLHSFNRRPVLGYGAGTFQIQWLRNRPTTDGVNDGHSLYLETIGELGLVGAALIAVLVAGALVGLAIRVRRSRGTAPAAVFAATLAWALHAGIDWDWEMPAVSLWVFAAAGTFLAAAPTVEAAGAPAARPLVLGRTARVLAGLACLILAITPARIALSQARLNASVVAYKRGDCGRAISSGLSSASAFPARPEPYEVVAYCDLRAGQAALGAFIMRRAVSLDPNDSDLRYGLGILLAASGQDPRPELRAAARLDPRGSLAREVVRRFGGSPQNWRRGASRAPLPLGL
jgi:O-antigen ligase